MKHRGLKSGWFTVYEVFAKKIDLLFQTEFFTHTIQVEL
jgi:hypothetical protein